MNNVNTNTKVHIVAALQDELLTAYNLIAHSIIELESISLSNNFYFIILQNLSQGFERLMKVYLCLAFQNKKNAYPPPRYFKKYGHDLVKIKSKIIADYFINHGNQFELDYEFLVNNENLNELLKILSDFGKYGRYYNLDYILGNNNELVNPIKEWEKLENKLMDKNSIKKLMHRNIEGEVYIEINQKLIILIEKFTASLSRQMNFKSIGKNARSLNLNSDQYGFGQLFEGDYYTHNYTKKQ